MLRSGHDISSKTSANAMSELSVLSAIGFESDSTSQIPVSPSSGLINCRDPLSKGTTRPFSPGATENRQSRPPLILRAVAMTRSSRRSMRIHV